ncbi:hypothetical protein CL622_07530 [archaeon]|nr:hypothetical protein [archaeon]|tara:strand:+ start:1197 stop:1598 length:402 start_codon:yes stop_codon:yes gene_type:complete
MSSVKQTSEINLANLVGKPGTDSQLDTLVTIVKRLDMAGRSLVMRTAIAASQVQNGHKPKSDKPREKSEFVTEVQAKRIADHFGEGYTTDTIVATQIPYDTAYAIVGAIISKDEDAINEQKAVLDASLAEDSQ